MFRLGKLLMFSGLVLLLTALWKEDSLPPAHLLRPELLDGPRQILVQRPVFTARAGGIDYKVQPLFRYDLHGLVVSRHDSDTWWDYIHKEWNDHLNVADLCVVFGENARSGAYRDISFSSGQFVCNFQTSSSEAFAAFDQTATSNNHLLTTDAGIAKRIRNARVGDQIHFTGYLAEYSHNVGAGFRRGTSTVRTDSGNGACETVFLESFEIVAPGGGPWPMLVKVAIGMMIGGLLLWFAAPVRFND
jgi:hypothetical protein